MSRPRRETKQPDGTAKPLSTAAPVQPVTPSAPAPVSPEPEAKADADKREAYLAAWKASVDAEGQISQRFDTAIFTLSSGFLAVATTFVHQITPHVKHPVLLYLIWASFGSAILLVMVALLVSEAAQRRHRDILEELMSDTPPADMPNNKLSAWVHGLNVSSAVFFALGIIFLAVFAGLEL